MPNEEPPYLAAIYYVNDPQRIAGTVFAIRDGLLVTCAHVVRDALGLGKPMPATPPQGELQVEFLYAEGQPAFSVSVAPGGWFPGESSEVRRGPLRDIAILRPHAKPERLPDGAGLVPDGWHGQASCLGFPAKRGGAEREISGNVMERKGTDGWLNLRPDHLDRSAAIGGMSGAPVWPHSVRSVGAMLSGDWQDDEHFLRLVPSSALILALERTKGQLADAIGKDASAALKEWTSRMVGSDAYPSPDDIRALCDRLVEEAGRVDNQLLEKFPYRHRYLATRFALLHKRGEREWPPQVETLGEFIADLADFLAEVRALPWDTRDQVEACDAAGRTLVQLLEDNGSLPELCPHCRGMEWPEGLDRQVRAMAGDVLEGAGALRRQEGMANAAQEIEDHAEIILAETETSCPHWSRMRCSADAIVTKTEGLVQQGPLPGLMLAATALKQRLGAASGAAISALAPLSRFQELPFAPEMIVIPPGSFTMGSPEDEKERTDYEGPQHEVTIAYRFAVGRYPVTAAEYAHFCAQTGREARQVAEDKERHPAVDMTWKDAKAYVEWLSGVAGAKYRLLSEAEWEYCCRAGTRTRYWFGDEISKDQAKFGGGGTAEVGSYPANGFGLYDMHGNVYDRVEDVWHKDYKGAPTDGSPWTDGGDEDAHVVRGGSWFNYDPWDLRSAYRYWYIIPDDDIGFRVARTLSPLAP